MKLIDIILYAGIIIACIASAAMAADYRGQYRYRPPQYSVAPVTVVAPPSPPTIPLFLFPLALAVRIPITIGEVLLTPVPVPVPAVTYFSGAVGLQPQPYAPQGYAPYQ